MPKKKISDTELIYRIKESWDPWSLVTLYNRYSPMISKHAFKLYRQVYEFFELEDIKQDYYFAFLKAIQYADPNKIKDMGSFSFSTIFWYHIKHVDRKTRKYFFQRKEELYESNSLEELDQTGVVSYSLGPEDMVMPLQKVVSSYLNSLSEEEVKIVESLSEASSSSKRVTSVAKALNVSYNTANKKIKSLQEKTKPIVGEPDV